jgi:hypothetical protein
MLVGTHPLEDPTHDGWHRVQPIDGVAHRVRLDLGYQGGLAFAVLDLTPKEAQDLAERLLAAVREAE